MYERCRTILAEELGAFPSPETEATYSALLGGDPRTTSLDAGEGQRHPYARVGFPFVGRAAELHRLETAWEEAVAGSRHTVVVKLCA